MAIHQSQQKYHKYSAFVLGNGTSRLSINPFSILNEGKIYGCNAQYREFTVDYLIAVDIKMVNEIIDSQYHKNNEVWTNPNRGMKKCLTNTKNSISMIRFMKRLFLIPLVERGRFLMNV